MIIERRFGTLESSEVWKTHEIRKRKRNE